MELFLRSDVLWVVMPVDDAGLRNVNGWSKPVARNPKINQRGNIMMKFYGWWREAVEVRASGVEWLLLNVVLFVYLPERWYWTMKMACHQRTNRHIIFRFHQDYYFKGPASSFKLLPTVRYVQYWLVLKKWYILCSLTWNLLACSIDHRTRTSQQGAPVNCKLFN